MDVSAYVVTQSSCALLPHGLGLDPDLGSLHLLLRVAIAGIQSALASHAAEALKNCRHVDL